MVETLHDNCFYYPDGAIKPYFKMKNPKIKEIIIQHPYMHFDPQNYKIFREEFVVDYSKINFAQRFVNLFEMNAKMFEGEKQFYETGYWSIIDKNHFYMGSGENELIITIKKISEGKFAFCLSNRDLVIIIKGLISNGNIKNKLSFDVYSHNYFLPFVEVLDPVRKTINYLGKNKKEIAEKLDFNKIFLNKKSNENLDTRYISCYLINKKNIMIPCAVAPIGRWMGPVVVPNYFKPFPLKSLDSLDFIFGQFSGGCMKSDFFRSGKFYYSCFIGRFSDVIVLNGYFRENYSYKRKKLKAINDTGIDTKYLDYFVK